MSAAVHLLLLRHAAHGDVGRRLTGRAEGGPLTPEGAAAAEALGRRLAREPVAEVHASPRLRARQTAEAVARATGAPLAVAPALDEVDFGAWTGLAFAELDGRADWGLWNRERSSARPPGGESMAEAARRAWAHAAGLAASRPGARLALVTHAEVVRALVATCLGLPLDHVLRLEVAPASVTRIEVAPWGARLLGLNDVGPIGPEEAA